MKRPPFQKRTLALIAVVLPLLALFVVVALRSGALAPVSVVLATVESRSLLPGLFGIGNVEARYTHRIGPTVAGRLERLDVHVGDRVKSGQVLGEMDPVDLDERIRAQDAALKRANAQLGEAQARKDYARTQALRYKQLLDVRSTSEEVSTAKQQELLIAEAGLDAAREDVARLRAELAALRAQRRNVYLISPVDGLVVSRDADPGTTVVAGQPVVELIDPNTLWVNVRFDQIRSQGLSADLPAEISLRSRAGELMAGKVLRVEPLADVVTEETLAKVVFNRLPAPLPPVGELAEVTVRLPAVPSGPVIPNAAIQQFQGKTGVWQVIDGSLRFTPVSTGIADLEGHVQVCQGLRVGDRIVVYSENALNGHSRIHIVDRIPGVKP